MSTKAKIMLFEDRGLQDNGNYLSVFLLSDGRVLRNEFDSHIKSLGLFSGPGKDCHLMLVHVLRRVCPKKTLMIS